MGTLEGTFQEVGIEGAFIQPLSVISTSGGPVLHFLRKEYALMPFQKDFGEIYFSEVYPGEVKAWKRHTRQNQLFAVPYGLLRIVLYDTRNGSKTQNNLIELILGRPDNYMLLRIPNQVWYGFSAEGNTSALICNAADIPHDPNESERLPADSNRIPYTFKQKQTNTA